MNGGEGTMYATGIGSSLRMWPCSVFIHLVLLVCQVTAVNHSRLESLVVSLLIRVTSVEHYYSPLFSFVDSRKITSSVRFYSVVFLVLSILPSGKPVCNPYPTMHICGPEEANELVGENLLSNRGDRC